MRVLWFSSSPGALNTGNSNKGYHGGGWIGALHELLQGETTVELAIAFPYPKHIKKFSRNGTTYYPIYSPPASSLNKLKLYYGGYKHWDRTTYVKEARAAADDFKPDVAHLFGIENPFNNILGQLDVPIALHLQGFLAPCDNAFFPQGLNKSSFLFPATPREWLLRNGYIFAKNNIHEGGKRELIRFKSVRHTMGRTQWDYQIARLLAPQATYRVVNEVLREPFYQHAAEWKLKPGKMIIVSTISQTIYKGLDLVLKTAALLRRTTPLDFEWHVVGIKPGDGIITFFERATGIKSAPNHVKYKGVLNADKLVDELLAATVYVHPSYIDNSPNSLCEAQMIGMPVIGTYVGGIPSLINDGTSGLLIPANAPFELAYHLKNLADNPQLATQLAQGAAQAASLRHNKQSIVTDLLNAYANIIKEEKK